MATGLDMTLDDLIKTNKKPAATGAAAGNRGRGRRSSGVGSGPVRRLPNRPGNRSAPYAVGKAPDLMWQHGLYAGQVAAVAGSSSLETGMKLYISNLDYGVSNEDIKELFSEVGELKRASINYDRSGRSKGTGEVVFSRKQDALAAIKRYNNVQLDGKPMKVEMVGTSIVTTTIVARGSNGGFGNPNGVSNSGQGRGFTGRSRLGERSRGRGSGRGRGRGRDERVSAAVLDADLDKYHEEAM